MTLTPGAAAPSAPPLLRYCPVDFIYNASKSLVKTKYAGNNTLQAGQRFKDIFLRNQESSQVGNDIRQSMQKN